MSENESIKERVEREQRTARNIRIFGAVIMAPGLIWIIVALGREALDHLDVTIKVFWGVCLVFGAYLVANADDIN